MTKAKDEAYWLKKAIKLTDNRSASAHIDDNLPRIGAVLVQGRHQIASGVNLRKSHPLQEKWGHNRYAIFLHAEIATIINAIRVNPDIKFNETTLYIGRSKKYLLPQRRGVTTHTGIGLARPCSGCLGALAHYEINRVVHTVDSKDDIKWNELSF